tara:strand:- start:161 stop:448 length:288 start_codon:yes stop_codon:yes gene_type:complete
MKEYIVEVTIVCALSALLAAGATWHHVASKAEEDLKKCNANTAACHVEKDKICHSDYGHLDPDAHQGVRLVAIECHGKQELCFCGTPDLLKSGAN